MAQGRVRRESHFDRLHTNLPAKGKNYYCRNLLFLEEDFYRFMSSWTFDESSVRPEDQEDPE